MCGLAHHTFLLVTYEVYSEVDSVIFVIYSVYGTLNVMYKLFTIVIFDTLTVSKSDMLAVGKIARRVSFVHYPEPEELQEQNPNNLKQMYEKSATLTNSFNRFATPSQSSRSKHLQSGSGLTSSSHGSRRKGSLFAPEDLLKTPKRKHVDEPTKSKRQLGQGSDQSGSVVPSSGSLEHSEGKKSKKRNSK